MIFPATSDETRPIVPDLLSVAQKIEERSPGLRVLAARTFCYPVQQQEVSIRADQYRKINPFEKFVLRAFTEVSPTPSFEQVADALGLDPIFIRSTFDDLRSHQSMSLTDNSPQVTQKGKESLSSETLSDEPVFEIWYLIQDAVLGIATFLREPLDEVDEELEDLSSYVEKDLTQFPDFEFDPAELQAQLQELGLDLHNPDKGSFVTEIVPTEPPELRWKPIDIFVLHDTLSENADQAITFQARSEDGPLPMIGEWLEAQLQGQNLSLKTLCGLTDTVPAQQKELQNEDSTQDPQVEERLEEIRQQATSQLRLKRKGQTVEKEAGTATQLRDVEIRPAFLTALQNAREQIIIYSPWINEQVVDDAFLSLLENRVKQGVRILIGYGIGRDEKKEERPIPQDLPQRLRTIQTAEGTPGIIAEWLGNSHAKEIVIDQSIHFSGSHNWLSYRGDRLPRGETVYQVTIASEVEKAYTHLARRFIERAQALWSKTTDEERSLALCILGYLDREREALEWLQRDTRYHLIPLWLKLARQTIAARHEERILAPLQTVTTLCCTAISPEDPVRVEVVKGLRGIVKVMRRKNQEVASIFVNECSNELRQLGIEQQ